MGHPHSFNELSRSRAIGSVLGPFLLLLTSSEFLNFHIWARQPDPALVYLNGMILAAAGLTLLRLHWRWRLDWSLSITLTGTVAALGGVFRLYWPSAPQADAGPVAYAFIGLLAGLGLIMSIGALGGSWRQTKP